jgi:hypothetical protein
MPNPTADQAQAYIADLYRSIECSDVAMAVVDYLGRVDADGQVKPGTCLRRRYGVRGMSHVKIYNLEVLKLNPKAQLMADGIRTRETK